MQSSRAKRQTNEKFILSAHIDIEFACKLAIRIQIRRDIKLKYFVLLTLKFLSTYRSLGKSGIIKQREN